MRKMRLISTSLLGLALNHILFMMRALEKNKTVFAREVGYCPKDALLHVTRLNEQQAHCRY